MPVKAMTANSPENCCPVLQSHQALQAGCDPLWQAGNERLASMKMAAIRSWPNSYEAAAWSAAPKIVAVHQGKSGRGGS